MSYQRKDAYYRRAKAEGLRARSAYKLSELDDRYRLLRSGDRVVDLGAWPGGWARVALDRVGPSGRVVAVDLVPIDAFAGRPMDVVAGDIRDPDVLATVRARLGGPADVVLSDAAPKLSGVRAADEARCAELIAAVFQALDMLLKPGGRALVKIFMDSRHQETLARARKAFRHVKTTRAEASRRGSAELYVLGENFTGSGDQNSCG